VHAIRAQHHLDEPVVQQYLRWAAGAVRLDFGDSIQQATPVASILAERATLSLELGAYGFLLAVLVGVPAGLLAAVRRGGVLDRFAVGAAVMAASVPAFATGLLLTWVFAVKLQWLPSFGSGEGLWDSFLHLTLPAIALGLPVAALIVKVTRASVARELEREYTSFARARGMSGRFVLWRYALRNAMVPIVTSMGLVLYAVLANAVVVEATFALPGLGSLLVESVTQKDIPVVQALTLVFGALLITINIVVDILYTALDPRIELGAGRA
jgi:peptide/nickel transport system permease protein